MPAFPVCEARARLCEARVRACAWECAQRFRLRIPPPRRLLRGSSGGGGSLRDFATAARRPPRCNGLACPPALALAQARAGSSAGSCTASPRLALHCTRPCSGPPARGVECSAIAARGGAHSPGRARLLVREKRQKVPTFETARPSAAMTSGEPPADGNQSFDGRAARAGPAVASLAGRASRSVWPHAGPGPIRVSQALGDRTPALARPDHGGDGAAVYDNLNPRQLMITSMSLLHPPTSS